MSLEQALQKLRHAPIEPPTYTDVVERRRSKAKRALPQRRLWVALAATMVAIAGYLFLTIRPFVSFAGYYGSVDEWWRISTATIVPAALLGWAYRCARRDGVGPQMLARAIWWSNLLVGMLIAGNFLVRADQLAGAAIAVACAVPLLLLGTRGLDAAPGDPFQPVRFRGQLLLALVMAFADAQTLLFSAVMQLRIGMSGWTLSGTIEYAGPAALAAGVMALAVWGLYRLRTWALFLNMAANFAIAYYACNGTVNVAPPVALALLCTAACQSLLPVPILAIALGDKKAGRPVLQGVAPHVLRASVIAIAGAAIVLPVVVDSPGGWLSGPGRAFGRGIAPSMTRRGLWDHKDTFSPGVNWSGQKRSRGRFVAFDLWHANLGDAVFRESKFISCNLIGADLSRSDFTSASFQRADLRLARLDGAKLVGADLRKAKLHGASLEGADLRDALIDPDLPPNIRWTGAVCPDGVTADPQRGCAGHENYVPADEVDDYRGTYERECADGQVCPDTRPTRALVIDGYLFFLGDFLQRRDRDLFAHGSGTIRFDRTGPRVRAVVPKACDGPQPCAPLTFRRVE